ncbi:SGNH/GDSL hydrolase family protein [Kibdelosporangium philippinense]|uniref:SGNH/GDSL hydrolase family protein n=1 Tax=Kibdelosporangium philippinense TaxID=211113 RepID=A0ABS8Z5N0_9PSEU|nr:SGNH/GDSL hydrolase family protein [Kibdelosporangium philippinense]MCE7002334.1 SGNH/GDSL hydrolase family protein [Kibdelosporangium philippinense]
MRILALVAVTAVSMVSPVAQAAAGPIGTWSVSPQASNTTFNQQTLRQIAHTSISGNQVRIRLSNVFGSGPLTVDNVHIARRTRDSSIDTATDRQLTFAGRQSVTIPAGSQATSDFTGMAVPALSDLAVSFYLPQPTGPATFHQEGKQTNYIAAGNVSGNANLTGAGQTGSYYFLTNVDVTNGPAVGAVVTLGASITDGTGSSDNNNRRWPNRLAERSVNAGGQFSVLNQGISGNRLLADGAGQSALNRFDRDVAGQAGIRWLIFSDDPINDLTSTNPTVRASELINAARQLISRAHQRGLKFICSTLTPYKGWSAWSPDQETQRVAYNAFVRGSGSGCDAVLDQDSVVRNPNDPATIRPEFDTGDHLHPNESGLRAIANAVDLRWFS